MTGQATTPGPVGGPTDGPVTVSLDVGGTKVAGGLVDAAGRVHEPVRQPTLMGGARDPGSVVTLGVARALLGRAAALGWPVDGMGAGFPEYVDATGRLTSHEVLAWERQPAELLGELAPTTVESDVRCAALAEATLGAGRGANEVAYVTVGTGISFALVSAGVPRRGRRGEAIALGELEVPAAIAGVGATLEAFASGDAIRRRFGAASGREAAGAAEVLAAAERGDATALAIAETAGGALGAALATLVALLDPDRIVLGGGMASAGGAWRRALDAAYLARAGRRPGPPPVVVAALGAQAGIVGAALAHRRRDAPGG